MSTFGRQRAEVFDRAARSQYYRDNVAGLTAFERHTKLIQDALGYDADSAAANADSAAVLAGTRTDADVLRERYRFIRSAEDDVGDAWEVKLARKYYARLFKEYAIADLSRYKQGAIGLRWRTHAEVVSGKGQFICGARGCDERRALASFEVPFAYKEAGRAKQALVKLRLCPRCANKLNYKRGSSGAAGAEDEGQRKRGKDKRARAEGDASSEGDREKRVRATAHGELRLSGSENDGLEDAEGEPVEGSPVPGGLSSKGRRRGSSREGGDNQVEEERQRRPQKHKCSRQHHDLVNEQQHYAAERGERVHRHSSQEAAAGAQHAPPAAAAVAAAASAPGPPSHDRPRQRGTVEQQKDGDGAVQDGSAPVKKTDAGKDADELEFERILESMFAQI